MPCRMLTICCWKCSGALDIPKGSLLKQKQPNDVIKVVSGRGTLDLRGSARTHYWASSLLKIVAPVSCASVSSTLGRGYTSRCTPLFSRYRSTQIRTDPFFFGMATIPAHHKVGCSNLEINPIDFILLSSSRTLSLSGSGTFLNMCNACDCTSGRSCMT